MSQQLSTPKPRGPQGMSGVLTSQAKHRAFEISDFLADRYKLSNMQSFLSADPLETMRSMQNSFDLNEGGANRRRILLMVSALQFARMARDDVGLRESFFKEPIFGRRKMDPGP